MFAKLNHLAIVSENYTLNGRFYEAMFGMRGASRSRIENAIAVTDGYVGLNINPRRAGRGAWLEHFGVEVEDVETVFQRMRQKYPKIEWLKRPSNRPFAGITTHDPNGNVFDLSQKKMANRTDIYEKGEWRQDRYISHVALRTLDPDAMADFYADVFGFDRRNRHEGDNNQYVTDGRVTLVLMPWHITDYDGTGIVSPGMDHIGFTVESMEKFEADLERVKGDNAHLAPREFGGAEGKARLALAERSCPLAERYFGDPDGVLLAAAAA
jgi:catechol 2,3-dioxygenase-like lactoylglutathione lyase family enzyme